jgi:hypothetical protein
MTGWTYDEYMSQPEWLVEMVRDSLEKAYSSRKQP